MSRTTVISAFTLMLVAALAVNAQVDEDNIFIHGFGGWAYGVTDGNNYVWATENGTWDYWDFALNINALVADNLRVNTQFYTDSYFNDATVKLDYAFVEYSVSDALNVRAGKVKHPFGIYGEILKAGTLRPFFTLPNTIYGNAVMVSEGYTGVGLVGEVYTDNDWGFSYHVFTGKFDGIISRYDTPVLVMHAVYGMPTADPTQDVFSNQAVSTEDVIGGKLMVETPMDGLTVGVSTFTGEFTIDVLGDLITSTDNVLAFSLDYNMDPILVRAEFTTLDMPDIEVDSFGFYVEGAVKLTQNLQAAVRYETTDVNDESIENEYFPTLVEHEEWAFGLNYIVSPNMIIRGSYHTTTGNFVANPANGLEAFLKNELNDETGTFIFGTNFSF